MHLVLLLVELVDWLEFVEVELGFWSLFFKLPVLLKLELNVGPDWADYGKEQVD